jgi:hypothetical protein
MEKINKDQFYSLLDVQRFTGIKTRAFLSEYIKVGTLLAIKTGEHERTRYAIRGEWLIDFIKRYDKGLVKGKKFSKEEVKKRLEQAINNLEK